MKCAEAKHCCRIPTSEVGGAARMKCAEAKNVVCGKSRAKGKCSPYEVC